MLVADTADLPFPYWRLFKEVDVRGKWITVSAQLEYLLSKIIVYSHAKNPSRERQLGIVPFHKKLSWAKKDLERAYPDIYNKLKHSFNRLQKLSKVRNHVAHYSMMFDNNEKDKSFVLLRSFVYKDGINQLEEINYPMEYLDEKYNEFKSRTKDMINVWIDLVNDYSKDDPNFSALSKI